MVVSTVYFNEISLEIVRKVVEKGETFSSAGGFRIEDVDLNPLIRDLEGSVDSIMGMPISRGQ
jgi:predicted house-cleaning NTP pyrophosphatase (Maf/HAM1 superfamily)